ncbi:MAG TPA: hypothetical protein VIV60_28410 [Polyangiaceae bacterium]
MKSVIAVICVGCFIATACSEGGSNESRNVTNAGAPGNGGADTRGNIAGDANGTDPGAAAGGKLGTAIPTNAGRGNAVLEPWSGPLGTLTYDATSFRFSVNPGYYGSGIDRRESAQLSVAAGANSLRTTLPEYYLEKWGDAIETEDYAYYETLGLGHHVCFLVGPSHAHSNAPASAADWELAHYSPKHLYEPIFLADGAVNPENYWAAYVERVAKNYGRYIDLYEVWNEPDQVGSNWKATEAWAQSPPKPADLIWWNDTIFSYVRALRITYEVVHRFDPEAAVTVGGIGYTSFLSALLRYTDEPNTGAVTTDYPATAAAYLDLVSYHYYPVFGGGSSDRGTDGLLQARNELRTELSAAGVPQKRFVVTETGAPRYAVGGNVGGVDYSVNYLIKAFVLARVEGIVGVDWFAQGDGAAEGASTDSFEYMGLYFDYSQATQLSDVHASPQGKAYAWIATWLKGGVPDITASSQLALPATARGAAFKTSSGRELYVLWALTAIDETATSKVTFAASGGVVHRFDPLKGDIEESLSATSGNATLDLDARPLVVELP